MQSNDLWPIEEINERRAVEIITTRKPLGKFVHDGITGYLAIDNRKGKATAILFKEKQEAKDWLNDGRD